MHPLFTLGLSPACQSPVRALLTGEIYSYLPALGGSLSGEGTPIRLIMAPLMGTFTNSRPKACHCIRWRIPSTVNHTYTHNAAHIHILHGIKFDSFNSNVDLSLTLRSQIQDSTIKVFNVICTVRKHVSLYNEILSFAVHRMPIM